MDPNPARGKVPRIQYHRVAGGSRSALIHDVVVGISKQSNHVCNSMDRSARGDNLCAQPCPRGKARQVQPHTASDSRSNRIDVSTSSTHEKRPGQASSYADLEHIPKFRKASLDSKYYRTS